MTSLKNVQTILFDYDGTLHNSTKIYIPAFKKAYAYLVENKQAVAREWEEEEITKWLGYSKNEMWQLFMPELPERYQQAASAIIGKTMLEKINNQEAVLYEEALETLDYLKQKNYTVLFLSNCTLDYMQAQDKAFGLSRYFSEMYCTEMYDFKKSKLEIVNELKENYAADFLIVGDRYQDIAVAQLENTQAVGCTYGFGSNQELKEADYFINTISELKQLV